MNEEKESRKKNAYGLTDKEFEFLNAYVNVTNFNVAEAMKQAGYAYASDNDARRHGRVILAKSNAKRRLSELLKEREHTIASDSLAVLEKLKELAFPKPNSDIPITITLRALELLGKHHQMFTERQIIETKNDAGEIAKALFKKSFQEEHPDRVDNNLVEFPMEATNNEILTEDSE